MAESHLGTLRGFMIVLYNRHLEQRISFALPLSIVVPFGNRLFRELLPDHGRHVREPWYELKPHCIHEPPRSRSLEPLGHTSLVGTPYIPEEEPLPRVYLHPDAHISTFTLRLLDFQTELYRGEYRVDDIFLASAEQLARLWIKKGEMQADEGPFYYAVLLSVKQVSTLPQGLFPPEAYDVEGVFQLPQLGPARERIPFRKVRPEPLPESSLNRFGKTQSHGRGREAEGRVFMHAAVYEALLSDLPLSDKVEDGGYLIGFPYRQPGSPSDEEDPEFRWLLEITDVVPAEGLHGSLVSLLFTGETWSRITRRIDRDYPEKKLLCWFHTHLFPATDEFGLSGTDVDLHRRFLTKPWQVAVLLNIDPYGNREVRCFQRSPEGDLIECTFDVIEASQEEPVS